MNNFEITTYKFTHMQKSLSQNHYTKVLDYVILVHANVILNIMKPFVQILDKNTNFKKFTYIENIIKTFCEKYFLS